jgi:lysophospholipase L1-like esterase
MNYLRIVAGGLLVAVIVYWFIPSSPKIRNAVPRGETIVCFGDSLTAGVGAGRGRDYPSLLAKLAGREVINAGVSGDTTGQALARLDAVIELRPRIVLLTLGGNDLKNGVDRGTAFENLEMIVRGLQDTGALVVIGGIDVPFWGRGFGAAYEDLAEKTGAVLVPNIYADIIGKPDRMSDGIHPNGDGYAIMARHFYKALRPYL